MSHMRHDLYYKSDIILN